MESNITTREGIREADEKKSLRKKIFKYVWVAYAMLSMFIVLYFVNKLLCKDIMQVNNRIILNDGWDVTINETKYEDVSFDTFVFDTVNKGDKVIIETTLPNTWEYGEAVMCIHNRHTALTMYVDGELEYQYGQERVELNKATGSGYLLINCYDDYKGKTLRLEFDVTENGAFSSIDEVWISEWSNSYRYILTENRLPLVLGSFLLVLGFFVTFIAIFAVTISKQYRSVLYISLFSICVGIWTLCYYNVVLVFSIPLYSISLMEYMSLFLAPLPIIGYMKSYVKELKSKKTQLIYRVLFSVQLILTLITIILHTTDTVHGVSSLPFYQVLFVVHLIFFSYVLGKNMKKNKVMNKYSRIGMLIVCACVLYDICSYILARYFSMDMLKLKGMSSLGIIVFIVILILDLYYRAAQSMMEEQERTILVKRAYTDELTQINNRCYCSQYMEQMRKNNVENYAIFNFDLNDLKLTNDTYGHIKGDELICAAAEVISKAFSAEGVVGRMGGDEFIAIVENCDKKDIDRLLTAFSSYIDEANENNKNLKLSISYGYAINSELSEHTPEKVYQLADDRMYAHKKMLKKARRA